jgi:hypothetical protein
VLNERVDSLVDGDGTRIGVDILVLARSTSMPDASTPGATCSIPGDIGRQVADLAG